jgi:hypothetical protein
MKTLRINMKSLTIHFINKPVTGDKISGKGFYKTAFEDERSTSPSDNGNSG